MASDTAGQLTQYQVRMKPGELHQWLDLLVERFHLIAPRLEGGMLLYRHVDRASQIEMDYVRPVMSLKDVLFPPAERLFMIQRHGQQVELVEQPFDHPQVVWGVRSCDARGVQLLDAVFLENDPLDVYYARRRQQTTLIGLACHEPAPSCFCEKTGGAPDDPSGMDIMIDESGGSFNVHVLTRKGQQLMEACGFRGHPWMPIPGSKPGENAGEPVAPGQLKKTLTLPDWAARMANPYWQETAERCLSCRVCAYVCPTCRCFDIRDEAGGSWAAVEQDGRGNATYERIRCWDSCTGENYRQIGGGHRPRAEKGERLRNRFLCKFYYYPEQYHIEDGIACTGCGRCVEACPVNIDIREVIANIQGWIEVKAET
jgi:sulfhydrogenase subunit beta (sulfur reductase)